MPSSWEPMPQPQSLVHQTSSSKAKIALFRSLFRGREDVYPRRFESRKTGKSGYALACANEWVRGICEKPRIKCAECPHRRFLPVSGTASSHVGYVPRLYDVIASGPSAQVDSRDVVSPQSLNQRAPRPPAKTTGSGPRSSLVPCRICNIDAEVSGPILPIASLPTTMPSS